VPVFLSQIVVVYLVSRILPLIVVSLSPHSLPSLLLLFFSLFFFIPYLTYRL
jgi:hypothetical protein